MNYEQFICAMMECAKKKLPEDEIVERHEMLKNNGVFSTGLSIRKREKNIAPMIYLEEYYESYQAGEGLETLAERFIRRSKNAPAAPKWDYDSILDFSKMKDRIVYKLINAKRNARLLREVPYLPMLDFAIVFYLMISADKTGSCSVLIKNSYLQLWKLPVSVLYQCARENTPGLCPCVLRPLTEYIEEMSGEKAEECPMLVLTNETGLNGAAAILYPHMPKKIEKQVGGSYYLLPASIHEFLVVPEEEGIRPTELLKLVKEVNDTQIREEELLSDHIYHFDGHNITKM